MYATVFLPYSVRRTSLRQFSTPDRDVEIGIINSKTKYIPLARMLGCSAYGKIYQFHSS